jgi:hypothetical protein
MAEERKEVWGFTASTADALLMKVGVEPNKQIQRDLSDGSRMAIGYTAGGVTARSGTTLGTGTFVQYVLIASGSNKILTASTDTTTRTCYNLSTTAVGAAKYVMLLRWGDCWVVNWEEC